jgi:hypothetical protein
MSYEKNNNNLLEKFLGKSENLHLIEDFLRDKLLTGKVQLFWYEILIIARILWGRVQNSTVNGGGKLDARHSKAQMITLLCISFYLTKYSNLPYSQDVENLHTLLKYHLDIIISYVSYTDSLSQDYIQNYQYYQFCKKWVFFCDALMKNTISSETDIVKKHQSIALTVCGQTHSNFQITMNTSLTKYLKSLRVNDFTKL